MTVTDLPPTDVRPADGRFGAGPSRIRPDQLARLASSTEWGTSHRKAPVIDLVKSIQAQMAELFSLPAGYEIALGNGGASAFWPIAATSLMRERAQLAVNGEFSRKFAKDAQAASWLTTQVEEGEPGDLVLLDQPDPLADTYAYAQNETSTGVASPVYRPETAEGLVLVDATSIAGAAEVDLSQADAYYFSLQKAFGADGGLWAAILSPAAIERAAELAQATDRPQFGFLNLDAAIKASRKGQTVNTPAIGTLLLLDEQLSWMLESGGLSAMAAKAQRGADLVQDWAAARDFATPFVTEPAWRSPVVSTIEIDPAIPVGELSAWLRSAGMVDVDAYRGIGQNQLRISSFPAIETADIAALLACVDWYADRI